MGRVRWGLGQGGVWNSKGSSGSPLHSLPATFEPPVAPGRPGGPPNQTQLPNSGLALLSFHAVGQKLFCPDSSLVGAAQSPLVASAPRT